MRTVNVGIGHQNDFAVAEFVDIEIVADTATECLNDGNQRLVGIHLVKTGFFHVQDFTAQRQNRLITAVASVFCGTAGGISLDKIHFGESRFFFLAVGKFAG